MPEKGTMGEKYQELDLLRGDRDCGGVSYCFEGEGKATGKTYLLVCSSLSFFFLGGGGHPFFVLKGKTHPLLPFVYTYIDTNIYIY